MSYIDDKIILMRKKKAYIKSIHKWVCGELPMFDEQVCLARVLDVLDENNMAVSKNEVRSAFNQFYNRDYHGDKQSYMTWLCDTFRIKSGTVVSTANVRSQVFQNKAVPHISQENNAQISIKIEDSSLGTGMVVGGVK